MKQLIPGVSKWRGLRCELDHRLEVSLVLDLSNRKDVRLPVQLQRAMAAEAEAAREARAKVIKNDIGLRYFMPLFILR